MEATSKRVGGSFSARRFAIQNAAIIMCVLLFLFNSTFTRNFLNVNSIWNMLAQTASIMFVTMGMTLVISSGCTDLSVGAIMAVASSMAGEIIIRTGSAVAGLLAALAAGIVMGVLNGVLVAKLKIQPLVAMLVSRMVYRAAAQIYTRGITKQIKPTTIGAFVGQLRLPGLNMPYIVLLMALVVLVTVVIVKKTTFGKRIEAVGNNNRTAYLCGISVSGTIIAVYVVSAIFASIAGALELFRSNALDANTIGLDYEMFAIAATTIGGTSMRGGKARIVGSVFGALLMTLITMTVNYANITYEMANVFKAFIIIFALALQASDKS